MFLSEPHEQHLIRAAVYIARRLDPQLSFEQSFSLLVHLKVGGMREVFATLVAGIDREYAALEDEREDESVPAPEDPTS